MDQLVRDAAQWTMKRDAFKLNLLSGAPIWLRYRSSTEDRWSGPERRRRSDAEGPARHGSRLQTRQESQFRWQSFMVQVKSVIHVFCSNMILIQLNSHWVVSVFPNIITGSKGSPANLYQMVGASLSSVRLSLRQHLDKYILLVASIILVKTRSRLW